ncbi:MAG TPA: B12-binding domain-containing radical SAM protein [Anaerolineae bacterium]|nr:B12-binding domain-containing radical SAM protein [Anaerolineae bacterium]HOQ97296.1 B12-binding domain-containing radical SAM protein [Anaerolineae bacterium]HOQ97373.1 B12-binding domain-containing radical SAM protein [Anaerolineae bacterium]HPL27350.1 B12-binding domain-containing radical SAM protein [Anaerolineae bacterium]
MRVLFVYPEFPDTFWSFRHALRFVSKGATYPPLGLITVAAMLPHEWEKRLVDMNVAPLTDRDLAWADYVFLGAMTVQQASARQVIARCNAAGVPIVAGGPLFTEEPAKFATVDYLVLNEAEITLPQFLRDLAAGRPQRLYRTSEFPSLHETPPPLWELLDLRRYADMCIQYSRGCPFSCEFCNITALYGHRPRTKRAAQVIAELDTLHGLGWRGSVFFVDDNLIGNKRHFKEEVLPALLAWKARQKGFTFQTEVSINLADDQELTAMMVAAGFDMVFVGIETPDEEALAECHKVQNEGRDLAESVRRLQRAGLQVQGGFIVGFDADTPAIFQRQIDLIQQSGIVVAMVGILQAPHGSALYERMQREGRLLRDPTGDNTEGAINFQPRMDPGVLVAGYRRIVREIYAPAAYYARVRAFLNELGPAASAEPVRRPLTLPEVVAFLRSVYLIGIRGVERRQYWSLVLTTLVRRPRLFPLAIRFAIYGHHCRRHAQQLAS